MQRFTHWQSIFENLYEGVYFVDTNRQITFWNKGAERITGFTAAEVVGRPCSDNILMHTNDSGTHLCTVGCPLHDSIQRNVVNSAAVYLQHKAGYRVPITVRTIPIVEGGETLGAVEVFQVLKEQFESTYNVEELKSLALTDQLTALPNRRYTEAFLRSKISEYEALRIRFGVLFLDIDHFKQLNDRYGHAVGDDVLQTLAKTYASNFRSSDLLGRWGGEEFLGICVCPDEAKLEKIAEKIRLLTAKTVTVVNGVELRVTVSLGATMFRDGDTLPLAIARADELLYRSKEAGRNRVTIG